MIRRRTPARGGGATRVVRHGVGTALVTVAVVVAVAGCGIPPDDKPEALPLPPGIRSTTTSVAPPAATATTGELIVEIFLTRDGNLVPVQRQVEREPSAEDLLRLLVEGATAEEEEQELSSLLEGIQTLSVAGTDDRIVDIDVGDGLQEISGGTQLLILGQIVCTLDARDEINGVRFSRDGQRLQVPRGDGTPTQLVLKANDYAKLLEGPVTPTPSS